MLVFLGNEASPQQVAGIHRLSNFLEVPLETELREETRFLFKMDYELGEVCHAPTTWD